MNESIQLLFPRYPQFLIVFFIYKNVRNQYILEIRVSFAATDFQKTIRLVFIAEKTD